MPLLKIFLQSLTFFKFLILSCIIFRKTCPCGHFKDHLPTYHGQWWTFDYLPTHLILSTWFMNDPNVIFFLHSLYLVGQVSMLLYHPFLLSPVCINIHTYIHLLPRRFIRWPTTEVAKANKS